MGSGGDSLSTMVAGHVEDAMGADSKRVEFALVGAFEFGRIINIDGMESKMTQD